LIKNPIATPAATTDYTLTVTNVYGCQKSDVVKVMVDGTSSIDVSQIGQIAAISPNPVSAIVTFSVSLKAETNVQLQIWDVTGRKVHSIVDYSLATGTHIFDWNTTGVAAGVYVAKWSLNGKTYTQKFVKE
jgi:flagellar hook assembly protein FlgD